MSKLKSGVYFVRYKDIDKFLQDAEKNGWQHAFKNPKAKIHHTLMVHGREEKTIKQLVIPFSLDKSKRRVGYWSQYVSRYVCLESDVEETMKTWKDYSWTDNYIEFYQRKKIIL